MKGPLRRLFNFIQTCLLMDDHGDNLFRNGAGKTFLYELLTMYPKYPCRVSIATTNHPVHDWCGVTANIENASGGLMNVSGVVDVLVRDCTRGQEALAVGEVKGGGPAGLWQLVAAMETIGSFSSQWPIGMVVHPPLNHTQQ